MIYTIENNYLKVLVEDYGAELQSIKSKKSQKEFLWQGSDVFWHNRATVIFPVCGRLFEGKYTYKGKEYQMQIHGFAKKNTFTVKEHTNEKIVLELTQNEKTLLEYPFEFILRIIYTLDKNKITQTFEVVNPAKEQLIFSIGGHPGFNVPIGENESFEDYYLEFDSVGEKQNSYFSKAGLTLPYTKPYPMIDGKIIPLTHQMFDEDAIFLEDFNDAVTLKSKKSNYSIRVEFKDMTKIGFWQDDHTEAPYVCIEPWHGMPTDDGIMDDLTTKKQMIRLDGGKSYSTYFSIEIGE